MVVGRLRVLLSVENEKNTDILLRFGQADLPNKSTNMSGDEQVFMLASLLLTWLMVDRPPISLEWEMDSGGVSLR